MMSEATRAAKASYMKEYKKPESKLKARISQRKWREKNLELARSYND